MILGFPHADDYSRAQAVLREAGYDYESFCQKLGEPEWITLRAIDKPRYERRVRESAPQQTLIRLFLLGQEVSAEETRLALRPMSLECWIAAGLLQPVAGDRSVKGNFSLTPFPGLVVAADRPEVDATGVPTEFVMSPGGTSLQLGWTAITQPARHTLDLGTGSGYLGLLAAGYSDRVVATDRSGRATAITEFNARLNGIDNLEARTGSSWEPVGNDRFDRVLCNPPFVITPHQRLMFRDSGMRGDEFCRHLIREAPLHLAEGGYCQMLTNFGHSRDSRWPAQLANWFADLGCDSLVLVTRQEPIDEYAMHWITTTESQDPRVVPRMFDEWMAYYESQQIEVVSYLQVNLRRRGDAANWICVDADEVRIVGAAGPAILDRFAALTWLHSLPTDAALLDATLVMHSAVRVVQEHAITPAGPRLAANRLEMRGGLRYSAELDANVMRLLVSCDGRATLRALLGEVAQSLGLAVERVNQIALPVVRHLVERGFLTPTAVDAPQT